MSFSDKIISGLKAQFAFKSVKGAWLQEGTCPRCGKKEVYCAADNPRMVKCGRIENCGWEDSVRNLLPDLFEDWSKRQPATPEDPTATADASLSHERGLHLQGLPGAHTRALFRYTAPGQASATLRFPTRADHLWERLIG